MIGEMKKPARRKLFLITLLSIWMGTGLPMVGFGSMPAEAQSMDYGALENLFGEPVTTSATGSPQRASDVPANMEIITADDIRRSGADNIPDILQFVAGVDVRRYGAAQAEVSIRGYNQQESPRLLVLINGRQVYLDDYGRTSWQSLPVQIDEIRQIEVVKGPNSALFGFNAVGGVINIITYDPLRDSTNAVTVRGGTQAHASGSAIVTLVDGDKAGLRLSVGGLKSNEFSTASLPATPTPYNLSPYQFSFGADGRLKLADNVELSAEATFADSRRFDVLPSPIIGDNGYRTNSLKFGVAADTEFGLLNFTTYRNELHNTNRIAGQEYGMNNTVYVVQASDLFKLGSEHTFRLSLEYRDNYDFGAVLGGKIGYSVYAASAMWSWQISPQLTLINAIRLDDLALNYAGALAPASKFTPTDYDNAHLTAPSANSGLVYRPTDSDTFRILAARGIQAPSLFDFGVQLTTAITGFPLTLAGSPYLKASTVTNYEIDYNRVFAPINAMLRTSIYYQKTDNLLATAGNAPLTLGASGLIGYSQNIGSSSAAGGEIALKGTSDFGLRWNVSYAFVSIAQRLTIGTPVGPAAVFDYRHGAPTSVIDLGVGYSWARIEVDAQARWQSHFTDYYPSAVGATTPFRINNYITTNARIGYRVTDHATLALAGEQLGQSQIFEAAGTPVERRITASITSRF